MSQAVNPAIRNDSSDRCDGKNVIWSSLNSPQSVRREPFDHADWLFELGGFRGLALIESGSCRLISRKAHVYKSFPGLELPHEAILDGEIVCLDHVLPAVRSAFLSPQ